jgi:hypothetical protein
MRLGQAVDPGCLLWQNKPWHKRRRRGERSLKNKNEAEPGCARAPESSGNAKSRHAFSGETDEMHRDALSQIIARGEDPTRILEDFKTMNDVLRARFLPSGDSAAHRDVIAVCPSVDAPVNWSISGAIYFDESVAAGIPTPGQPTQGRPAELADLMQGIDPAGKLLVKVSGHSMEGSSIEHGDTVLVDPKAEIRDGDLILANLAGHGQVVKRLRVAEDGTAFLESENPDFKPIPVAEAADLRIHGKVVWRCGPLR